MAELLTHDEVFAACRVLFGADVHLSPDFLDYLQPSGAKSAYRRRAKEVHPDLIAGEDDRLLRERARLFRELSEAFQLLSGYLTERERQPQPEAAPAARASTASRPRSASTGPERTQPHYRGAIPRRTLEIGLYLYYRGAVTFPQLIDALLWQRRQRPVIGSIARRWGWLNDDELQHILLGGGTPGRFGDRAMQLGLLTSFQVNTLLFFQRCQQRRLGEYFIERGILSSRTLDKLVAELQSHNQRIRRPAGRDAGREAGDRRQTP